MEVPHNSMGHHEPRPLPVKPRPEVKLRLEARIRQDARQVADMILRHCTMNNIEDHEEIVVLLLYNILQNVCVVFFVRIAFCNKTCGLHLKRNGNLFNGK